MREITKTNETMNKRDLIGENDLANKIKFAFDSAAESVRKFGSALNQLKEKPNNEHPFKKYIK